MKIEELKNILEKELQKQHFGVFNSVRNDSPHSTLVCFAPTEDLNKLIFFTPKRTRKFINTQIFGKVSLFIDTSTNSPEDVRNAITIAAYGTIVEDRDIKNSDFENYKQIYLKKNPHMEFFLKSNIKVNIINVELFEVVYNFQTVVDLDPDWPKNVMLIRQLQGTPIYEGEVRGKIIVIKSPNDINKIKNNDIIVCNTFTEKMSEIKANIQGIIEINKGNYSEIYAKDKKIPVVANISETINFFEDNDEMTIDGYLGIIIQHKIR